MTTLSAGSTGLNFTPEELESAALVRVALNNRLADDLRRQIDGQYQEFDEMLRAEITRLYGHSFEITRALNAGDPQRAYKLAFLENLDGTSLGRAA